MTEKELESKDRIISVSRILFAEKGFEGTTIRDIATAADVNVASVNYYFSSKDKLFGEVLRAGYNDCSSEVTKIMASGAKLEEGLVQIFRYYLIHHHDLLSMFKLMMSTQDQNKMMPEGDDYGPPGGKMVAEAIVRELGKSPKEEDLHWALKTLFSNVTHTAILYNCCFKDRKIPFTSDEDIEKNIRRLCRVVLADLK
ncbi:MAG: TetR/AcrR family transcriptional regulator [Bdellovibrionota bacterium]